MTLPVFWAVDLQATVGATVRLTGDEARHAAVVRRIRPGEQVVLTDGAGTAAVCEVTGAEKSLLVATVLSVSHQELAGPRLTVVQAIPKGERAELAVEVLTEVGVDRIVPWAASRCVGVWRGERAAKSLVKWRTTAREAAKQSRRWWFPEVTDQTSTHDVATLLGEADLAVVLHEEADTPLAALQVPDTGAVVVVVGPEGGIDPAELDAFVGASVVRLGPTVLRTSTAGVAAAAVLLSRTPRW